MTDDETRELSEVLRKSGCQRLDNVVLQQHGLVLIKQPDPALLEVDLSRIDALQPVSVVQKDRLLVISSGRYMVFFAPAVAVPEAAARLERSKFEIVERPEGFQHFFVVRRLADSSRVADHLAELRRIPGVSRANPQNVFMDIN
ncbi:MAG: hypothetical protein HYR60_21570 [Acidobacteria bacterium]|nr:hypothetical protein [Acidobacteriota bacterium]